MSQDLVATARSAKEYLHILSLMSDENLIKFMTVKTFQVIRLELQIELAKSEIERRADV